MAAKIFRLPRFEGDKVRQADPARVFTFDEALDTIGDNADEWRDRVAALLQDGPFLIDPDNGREHVAIDANALQALGEVLSSMGHHLHRMAEMHRAPDSAAPSKPASR